MKSQDFNIWKVKTWLSQERKELSMWNKKLFLVSQVLSFKLTKQTNKNLANATFNCFEKKGSIIIYIWQGIE